MPVSAMLSDEAIQLFKHQWGKRLSRSHDPRFERLDCPLQGLMPELLRVAQEFSDSPTLHEMRPLVRRMVEDRDAVFFIGLHPDVAATVFECYVDTLIDVLAEVRDHARERGLWVNAHADATPIMCG